MLEAQKEIKHAVKDSKNPHMRNTYASLNAVIDEVKPVLNKHGLVLTQLVHMISDMPGYVAVSTKVVHAESGEFEKDQVFVPVKHKFNKEGVDLGPDAQELGSAITYGRRYGLQALCAIASEDDDGNSAAGVAAPVSSPAAQTPAENKDQNKEVINKLDKVIGWKPLK